MSNEEKVYWQRRIYDAKYDKCCEIVTTTKEKPNKKELEEIFAKEKIYFGNGQKSFHGKRLQACHNEGYCGGLQYQPWRFVFVF